MVGGRIRKPKTTDNKKANMNEPKFRKPLTHGYPKQQQEAADQYGQSRVFPVALPKQSAANVQIDYNPSGRRYRLHAFQIQYQNTQAALSFDALTLQFNGVAWPGPMFIQGPTIQGGAVSRWMSGFIHGPAPYVGGLIAATGISDPIVYSMALPAIDWDGDVTLSFLSASGGNFTFLNPLIFIEFLP
jgi:hypothetical protein